jgi:hypothetical protein
MKRLIAGLLACLALSAGAASADHVVGCEVRARLRWQTCDRVTPADGNRLIVRYCFGAGRLGTFSGQIRILVSADEGRAGIGGEETLTFLGMRGCLQDEVGGGHPLEGDVILHVEVRGRGRIHVTTQTI